MFIIKEDNMRVPLKIWSHEGTIEQQCIDQMKTVCQLPFLHHHVALMSDGHFGKGASIGSVVATKNAIIVNLVGVDIGCGVVCVKTDIKVPDIDIIKKIMSEVRKQIPVGFNHRDKVSTFMMPNSTNFGGDSIISEEFESARTQLGTLGGGNHFCELQKDKDNYLYIMIHSGSRNLGKKVADHYNKLAQELNEKWFSQVPKEWDLAFLPEDSKEAQNYLDEMNYCLEFAFKNRQYMMNITIKILNELNLTNKTVFDVINIHHNYVIKESHFGQNVWIHRKGATLAREGTVGLIPGSQGTASYIVKGLGNPDSFNSCSHGAGRKMGRKEAVRTLDFNVEKKKLDDLGIVHSIRNKDDLEEASGAYKNIEEVMLNQSDLVEIITKLDPLAVIKG
jgi:tRNA-splicing ligase RtcB